MSRFRGRGASATARTRIWVFVRDADADLGRQLGIAGANVQARLLPPLHVGPRVPNRRGPALLLCLYLAAHRAGRSAAHAQAGSGGDAGLSPPREAQRHPTTPYPLQGDSKQAGAARSSVSRALGTGARCVGLAGRLRPIGLAMQRDQDGGGSGRDVQPQQARVEAVRPCLTPVQATHHAAARRGLAPL